MGRHKEPLNGGLWTAADPGVLEEGQLSAARNLIYLPGTQAVNRAPGRLAFGTATAVATAVQGLRDLQFDNGTQVLIAHTSSNYVSAAVGDSGTFGTLATGVGIGAQLEVVQFRNRFFLLNGAAASVTAQTTNRIAYLTATGTNIPTTRQHGMLPVLSTPVTASVTTAFSQTVTGYYEYWTTEMALYTQDGADFSVESTFSGTPVTVFVTSTGMAPRIQRPDQVNAVATHWRVYRSPKKDTLTAKEFPSGFLISSDISIAATSMLDSLSVSNTGFKFPANMNGVGDGATVYADMVNAIRVSADDNSDGTLVNSGALVEIKSEGVYGFNFGGFTGPVQGVEVQIEALVNTGTVPIRVAIVRQRQADGGLVPPNAPPEVIRGTNGQQYAKLNMATKSFTATTGRLVYNLGGANDRWFSSDNPIPLRDSDFGTNFMVVVSIGPGVSATTLSVDYVQVKVYYGGSIDSVNVFPTVVYSFGDISAQVGKNGPPPSSSTGDIYEDTLVVNDINNRSMIRYSYPGDPEAFPATYYVDFETLEKDQIQAIRAVNDRLIVWLSNSTWRMNYLPSERDASFDRGKAKQPISRSYGCVNPMCVTNYSPGGDREYAAFVADQGICHTDGFEFQWLTDQLDWRQIISLTSTSFPIALINDRERFQLLFYFRNDSYGAETYLCLPLCYDADHRNDGKPKAGGLIHMRNSISSVLADLTSAWAAPRSNGNISVYLGYGGGGGSQVGGSGKVFLETGTSMPAADPRLQLSTRLMYLADHGNEWRLNELYGYAHDYDSTPTISYSVSGTKTNDTGMTLRATKSITLGGQRLHKAGTFRETVEGAQINMVATASAFAQEFLILDGLDFGAEDAGRA